jgi:hypothetical protein
MYKLPRGIQNLLSRFIQTKYWNISKDYTLDTHTDIVTCIQKILEIPISRKVFLLWNNVNLHMIRYDLQTVIVNWNNICEAQPYFQILDDNADFLIDFSLEQGIKIKFNFGLTSKKHIQAKS